MFLSIECFDDGKWPEELCYYKLNDVYYEDNLGRRDQSELKYPGMFVCGEAETK